MICSKCGKEYADGVKFCTECGTELTADTRAEAVAEEVCDAAEAVQEEVAEVAEEVAAEAEVVQEVAEEAAAEAEEVQEAIVAEEEAKEEVVAVEKKKKSSDLTEGNNGKKPVAIGLALVAILFLIFIPVALSNSGDESYAKISEMGTAQFVEEDGDLYVYYMNGDKLKLDDEKANSKQFSMDGSVIGYKNDEKEIVLIKEGKVIKTGIDDVEEFRLSQNGDTMVYITDCESNSYLISDYGYDATNRVGTLCLYDIKKKTSIEIADGVVLGSAVLSPNGKTVAFVSDYEATDDFKGYYSVNGKEPVAVGKEKRVFAISDKGKFIYYMDVDRIYVMKNGKEEKLAGDLRFVTALMNADNTEMLFYNEDKTYVTVKGGEKKKIAGDRLGTVILNDDAASSKQELTTETGVIQVTYTGVDTFKEKLFSSSDDRIYYMMKNYETEKLATEAYEYVVAEDGKSLIYSDYVNLVKVTKFDKGGEKEVIAKGALPESIYADGDLKHIYLVNIEDELYYVKKGKGTKIADDITSAAISTDGQYCYYVVENEELNYSKNGSKEKELLVLEDGMIQVERECGVVIVGAKNEEKAIMYKIEGKKMKTLRSEEIE